MMEFNAIDQLKNRAARGDGQACFDLYQEYKNGVHVDGNEVVANDWLEKAIDCNHPTAQLVMGLSLLNQGATQEAIDYLELACHNFSTDAMNILGQLYLGNVEKVPCDLVDIDKGLKYLSRAAMGGNIGAQVLLGKCYYIGKWVTKDKFLSRCWLEKARDQGSDEAAQLLDEAIRIKTALN